MLKLLTLGVPVITAAGPGQSVSHGGKQVEHTPCIYHIVVTTDQESGAAHGIADT